MHEKFVGEFEEKERRLLGKIRELEIRLREKPPLHHEFLVSQSVWRRSDG
jgi:hypothetical protein